MPANVIGFDLGGTKIAAVRADDELNFLERAQLPTPRTDDELGPAVLEVIRRVWSTDVIAVGGGCAGLVRWPEGTLAWIPHVKGDGVDLRTIIAEAVPVPVEIDNDANAAALAEFELGAAASYSSGLVVNVGTGIGGGWVLDGEVFRGRSFAGEIGHMSLVSDGPLCPCGARGCWETVASGTALARMAAEEIAAHPDGVLAQTVGDRQPRGEDVTDLAAAGDERCLALVDEIGYWLGIGINNLIVAFDPEVVVVGGGMGTIGDLILDPTRRVVREHLYGVGYRPSTPVIGSAFRRDAGLIGGVLMAWREVSWMFRMRERTKRLTERVEDVRLGERFRTRLRRMSDE